MRCIFCSGHIEKSRGLGGLYYFCTSCQTTIGWGYSKFGEKDMSFAEALYLNAVNKANLPAFIITDANKNKGDKKCRATILK